MTSCCGNLNCPSGESAKGVMAPLYCMGVQKSIVTNTVPLSIFIVGALYQFFYTPLNLNLHDGNGLSYSKYNKFVVAGTVLVTGYTVNRLGLDNMLIKSLNDGVKVMSDLFNAQNQDDVNHQYETHFHNGHECHGTHNEVNDNFVQFYQNSNSISLEELRNSGFKQPETASKMIGIPGENNILVAHENGSAIFSRGTNNFIVASNKTDDFYFSLCSTKDVVIEEFDAKQDFIHFFCTKKIITKADINLSISANGTLITVTGDETSSSIFLSQVDDFSLSQIDYTNTKVQEINGIKALVELVASGETSNIIMEIN